MKFSEYLNELFIWLIKLYQRTLGILLPISCRFTPSCSHYAIEAIKRFGILKGGLLSLYRIIRCNPFCPGGHDPVLFFEKGERDGE